MEQDIARLDDPDFTTPSPIMRTTWGDGRRQGNSLEVDTFVNYPSSNDISLFNAVEFCQTIAQMLKGTGPSVVSGDTVS